MFEREASSNAKHIRLTFSFFKNSCLSTNSCHVLLQEEEECHLNTEFQESIHDRFDFINTDEASTSEESSMNRQEDEEEKNESEHIFQQPSMDISCFHIGGNYEIAVEMKADPVKYKQMKTDTEVSDLFAKEE